MSKIDFNNFFINLPVEQPLEKIKPEKYPNVFDQPQAIMSIFDDFFGHLNRDLTVLFKKPQRLEIHAEQFALVFLDSMDMPQALASSKNIEIELLGVLHRFEDVSELTYTPVNNVTVLSFKFAKYKASTK